MHLSLKSSLGRRSVLLPEPPLDFNVLLNTCVLFNDGKPLFHPTVAEATTYGVNINNSYVRNIDEQIVELQNWPTNDDYKKAIIDSNGDDIGFFSFRAVESELTSIQRSQLINGTLPSGVTLSDRWQSTIKENTSLQKGSTFKILFVRINNNSVVNNTNETSALGTYNLIDLFNNNHPLPQNDGYYVFIFSFGGMQIYEGVFSAEDTRYNLFYAKVA